MRDLVFFGVVCVVATWGLLNPFVAAMGYAWISLMNPHRLMWGFAASLPLAMTFALILVASVVFTRERLRWDNLRYYWPVFLYLAWVTITTQTAGAPEAAWQRYTEFVKTQFAVALTIVLLTNVQRVRIFVAVIALSIAFYGIKGGVFAILTAGSFRVWGPEGTMIADNNHLGLALLVMLPLIIWLAIEAPRRWMKTSLQVSAGLVGLAVVATYSRGAIVAAVAMAAVALLGTRRKVKGLIVLAVLVVAAAEFMPEAYHERIASIGEYSDDTSANERFETWEVATRVAGSRFTGGGFDYYANLEFWELYAGLGSRPRSTHSIYLQALGEQGWIGFALFCLLLARHGLNILKLRRAPAGDPDVASMRRLAHFSLLSLVGFMFGGAFLNLGYWDGFYYLVGLACAMRSLASQGHEAPTPLTFRPQRPLGRISG